MVKSLNIKKKMSSANAAYKIKLSTLDIAAILSWATLLTFLWPFISILKLSSRLRKRFADYASSKFFAEAESAPYREAVFQMLRENYPQYDRRHLSILEIGKWSKNQLDFYSEQHAVRAACENLKCVDKTRLVNAKNVIIDENENTVEKTEDNTYDVVMSTYFLCSVQNVDVALRDIRRILKPGGKFGFLEHVGYPENYLAYVLQRLMTPFRKLLFDGCRLDRQLSQHLLKSSFNSVTYKTLYPQNRAILHRPIIIGICTK